MFRIILKELREKSGLSQVELSALLGVSQSTVGMWESGKNNPTYNTLIKIADVFHVNVGYLSRSDLGELPLLTIPVFHENISLSTMMSKSTPVSYEPIATMQSDEKAYVGYIMPDSSMEPDLKPNDTLIVRIQSEFRSGDTVIFHLGEITYVRSIHICNNVAVASARSPGFAPIILQNIYHKNSNVEILGIVTEVHRRLIV